MGKALEILAAVVWVDATDTVTDRDELLEKTNYDFLRVRTSYGKVLKDDEHGISLINTEDKYKIEHTTIPRGWVKNVQYFRKKN